MCPSFITDISRPLCFYTIGKYVFEFGSIGTEQGLTAGTGGTTASRPAVSAKVAQNAGQVPSAKKAKPGPPVPAPSAASAGTKGGAGKVEIKALINSTIIQTMGLGFSMMPATTARMSVVPLRIIVRASSLNNVLRR